MKYENRIVAFVDILGFSSILNQTQIENSIGEKYDNETFIENLNIVFKRISDLMNIEYKNEEGAKSRQVTQFSDSIVISFKQEESSIEFRYLLEELLFLHIEMIRNDILIRGGISYGPMIHTKDVLFGPAMVHAYRVESKAAGSPRIILPPSLHDGNTEYEKYFNNENIKNELDDLLSVDEDDFYFLDYFNKCQDPKLLLFADDSEYVEHMTKMKFIIKMGLKNRDPGIYRKYGWMKSKWNNTVSENKKHPKIDHLKNERPLLFNYFSKEKLIVTSM